MLPIASTSSLPFHENLTLNLSNDESCFLNNLLDIRVLRTAYFICLGSPSQYHAKVCELLTEDRHFANQ